MPDWNAIAKRNSRSVQTTIGWIFWDPGAVRRFEALGLPGPVGYIASRCSPLAPIGAEAVTAAFGSIRPYAISFTFELVAATTDFDSVWRARNEAIVEGLHEFAPAIVPALEGIGPKLWPIVEQLPTAGRVFFASHLRIDRPTDPLLSGWHAVNCLREWRGDTHWAVVASAGLTGIEASILHNAWLGYEDGWLPTSRGSSPDEIQIGWELLAARGLVRDGKVTDEALRLRQRIEDDTDRLTTLPWELLGESASMQFAERFEPPCELLLNRVDETAGPNYQPASRIRHS
jgi:hypothetical protein